MTTFQIQLAGQVQGLGFRPFVYRLAQEMALAGWVSNDVNGVHIEINATEAIAEVFVQRLLKEAPVSAIVTKFEFQKSEFQAFTKFEIRHSNKTGSPSLLLTPDLGLCKACRNELYDTQNRRYQYAFTTCTHCGPRYSIIRRLPYDRLHTSMAAFPMCRNCHSEYENVHDRRYYAQTNSCPQCAIELTLWNAVGQCLSTQPAEVLNRTVQFLEAGKILSIKGIGGYLLVADATNADAIRTLRARKHRPAKPFALMYPNQETLLGDAEATEAELAAYNSIESPIVLFQTKEQPASGIHKDLIAPYLQHLGAMQPYTPLFELLCRAFGRPLLATSGNVSGSPIFFQDAEARAHLSAIADFFVCNNRDIVTPQDDSVVRFSGRYQQRVVLRRSRGYAPTWSVAGALPLPNALAMGADLKSAFALSHQGNTYLSQYLGDLENFATQNNYRHSLAHLTEVLRAHPTQVIVDKHPQYFSTQLGQEIAEQQGLPVLSVQHHRAHFAAVLAEHQLLDTREPVLGIIWDGTGMGDDGHIWGGECFLYCRRVFKRVAHFERFPHLLGNKMPLEPRLSALSLCRDHPEAEALLHNKFSEREWTLYQKMVAQPPILYSTSVGRLFDGVASLLGLQDVSTYEGEAAMRLEALARSYFRRGIFPIEPYWHNAEYCFDTSEWAGRILEDIFAGKETAFIAARFHWSLAKSVQALAERLGFRQIAFSGGVFQNTLLVDLLMHTLADTHQLYFHQQLSPNDECIAFGQLALAALQQGKDA
ncbi:MAG TPA: carbamoyltransferase HypF [Saprospiraceae bacterium]|nr:carbamoyltransferase HypF [Saprospiraceae bacterium]HMP24665.1 carbamoyltransferase HypF [Saprospiraceae bacterium]